jgi:RimJ/RimL family protein N-acetyltransferase
MEPGSAEWLESLAQDARAVQDQPTLDDLDPVSRFAIIARMLGTEEIPVDAQMGHLSVEEAERRSGPVQQHVTPDLAGEPFRGLQSPRIGLRPPVPDDADLIYQVVNDPAVSWRLPTRATYISVQSVVDSIASESSLITIGFERSTGQPVTVLALTGLSEKNGVGEFSFYSLRNSSDPIGGQSIEALVCFISHCFHNLSLRKLVASIPRSGYDSFKKAEGFVFEVEGVRRDHLRLGTGFQDLILIALFAEPWIAIERDLGPALLNWQQ